MCRYKREELQHFDDLHKNPDLAEDIEEDGSLKHTRIGAAQKAMTLADLQTAHQNDPAFAKIRADKLQAWLQAHLPREDLPSDQKPIEIRNDMVCLNFAYICPQFTQSSSRSLSIDFSKSTFRQLWTGES